MKRVRNIILAVLVMPLVSAAPFDFYRGRDFVVDGLENLLGILSPFFELIIGDYTTSEFFFHKILLFILLIIVAKNIIDKTPLGEKNKRASFLIAAIISILGIRFISENDFFEAIFIQYGVLGIAITTIIPMVIFFYFIHNTKVGTYGRKLFWTFYSIILFAIWFVKAREGQFPDVANWIYGATLVAAIIFVIFDKSIHGYFGLADFKKFQKKESREAILRAKDRLHKLRERLDNGIIDEYEYRQGVEAEERAIRELSKEA